MLKPAFQQHHSLQLSIIMGSGSVFYLVIVTILVLVILHYQYHAVGSDHHALATDYQSDNSDIITHYNDSEEIVIDSCSHPRDQDFVR